MRTLSVNEAALARVLADWEAEAKANDWPNRNDDQRHADNAAYLFDKLEALQAA